MIFSLACMNLYKKHVGLVKITSMKFTVFMLCLILLITGCVRDDEYEQDYINSSYHAVVMDISDLRNSVRFEAGRILRNPGKICLLNDFILINEKYKGIHIFDNSDSYNPVHEGFIHIPGCIDMAIKDNLLYADNSIDLVLIDIGDISDIKLLKRIESVFPEPMPPDGTDIPYMYNQSNRPSNTVIVEWVKN